MTNDYLIIIQFYLLVETPKKDIGKYATSLANNHYKERLMGRRHFILLIIYILFDHLEKGFLTLI